MPNPIVHWEIEAKDPKKLQGFYRSLFEWHIDTNNPLDYGLVDTHAEGGINGGITAVEGNAAPRTTIYVQVKDLAATLKKAQQLGAAVVMQPTEVPGMVTFAKFQDPDGNIIGLVKEDAQQR
jgi:predicted enzyme related to lactoylglutathione lyase